MKPHVMGDEILN